VSNSLFSVLTSHKEGEMVEYLPDGSITVLTPATGSD
jgi:hypothetical protein